MRSLLVALVVLATGCSCGSHASGSSDDDAGVDATPLPPGADAGAIDHDAAPFCEPACDATMPKPDATPDARLSDAPPPVEVCEHAGEPVACATNDDCPNDSACDLATNSCRPYAAGESDPACTHDVIVGVFAPATQCEWIAPPPGDPQPYGTVRGTPMVADFDFDDDPATLHPSIVFATPGAIRIIDGATCEPQHDIFDAVAGDSYYPPILVDLDGAPDHRPEIIAATATGGGLAAFRYDEGSDDFELMWATPVAFPTYGASAHDLDDDGLPELVVGSTVIDGRTGEGRGGGLSTNFSLVPLMANLDDDARVELIADQGIYEWDPLAAGGVGGWSFQQTFAQLGRLAIGDFGTYDEDPAHDDRGELDGVPEIVVSYTGIWTLGGRQILAAYGTTAPVVADFDGDGRAEYGTQQGSAYTVWDPDCTGGVPDPVVCASVHTDGVLWRTPIQDGSSQSAGSVAFDFEGDGRAEVVFADECFTRVFDGKSGETLFSQHHSTQTWVEHPVVADVDGDFNAEIVVPFDNTGPPCPALDDHFDGLRCLVDTDCPGTTTCAFDAPGDDHGRCRCTVDEDCGGSGYVCVDPIAGPSSAGKVCRAGHPGFQMTGVRVLRDILDRWVGTRPIWNQLAYSITNVNDDGSVPRTSEWARNWQVPGLNNYLQNTTGALDAAGSPDLTVRLDCGCADGAVSLAAELCNRGTEPVSPGVSVSFYLGDAATGTLLCRAASTAILAPAACTPVACDDLALPAPPFDLTAVADDDGSGRGRDTECHEGNNTATLSVQACGFVIP